MLTTILLSSLASAQSFVRYDSSECIGIYSDAEISGPSKSSINIDIRPVSQSGSLAIAIFPFQERKKIQNLKDIPDFLICTEEDVKSGTCLEAELNKFHLKESSSSIFNEAVSWRDSNHKSSPNITWTADGTLNMKYHVPETGFYCIFLGSSQSEEGVDYKSKFTIYQPYGKLPAIFYPALQTFFWLSIAYTGIAIVWLVLSFRYWKELLPIQNYFSGLIGVLIVEMALNYEFFRDFNLKGSISHVLLGFMVIFHVARNSMSFFMILVVSLGFGVVKATLGETMSTCFALTAIYFIFGALYTTGSLLATNLNSNLVLLSAIPLSLIMSVFYAWTIHGLNSTISHLESRKQVVKLLMYRRLWWILSLSLVVIAGIVFTNLITISHRNEPDWIENQWKWRWMLLEGSLHILYLVVFCCIAFLWAPTENNQRYGLEQVASEEDEDEFCEPFHDGLEEGIKMRKKGEVVESEDENDILDWANSQADKWGDFE